MSDKVPPSELRAMVEALLSHNVKTERDPDGKERYVYREERRNITERDEKRKS